MRDAGNVTTPKDWSAARARLLAENTAFCVFGGEPLLAPIDHLRDVFKFGYEHFGRNSIQTNGTLITDEHIALFREYNVGVGISVDGPSSLNSARVGGSHLSTDEGTRRTQWAIDTLCAQGRAPALIVTIHKTNAGTKKKVQELLDWFSLLELQGVRWINLHILEDEPGVEGLALNDGENIFAFSAIYEATKVSRLQLQPFIDIKRLLLQEEVDKVSCIWNSCDPLTTDAVRGISPDGTQSNCGRTNKEGVNWVKASFRGFERYLALYATPQEYGGCNDCRFFSLCRGQCPGTAIDKDWRNRTVHCRIWYELFEIIERDIVRAGRVPVTYDSAKLRFLENALLDHWSGSSSSTEHGDTPHGDSSHGDSPHGDGHGDSHGDHTDSGVVPREVIP
jgi:uncharacterized protein